MPKIAKKRAPAAVKGAARGEAAALVAGMGQAQGVALAKLRQAAERMGSAAVAPLKAALAGSPHREVRWEAAKALGHLASPASIDCLIQALNDEDADVGRVAAEALVGLKDAALRPLFRALVKHPESPGLRDGTRHVLRARKRLHLGGAYPEVLAAIEKGATHEAAAVAAQRALKAAWN